VPFGHRAADGFLVRPESRESERRAQQAAEQLGGVGVRVSGTRAASFGPELR